MKQVERPDPSEGKPKENQENEAVSTEQVPEEDEKTIQEKRYEIVNMILGKETFIDPLNPEQVTKAYSVYEKNPQKVIDTLVQSFQQYCRKCIRETAILEVKNELSNSTIEEAEVLRNQVIDKWNEKLKTDSVLEQLLIMLLFKNSYWEWVRFGLKDIFSAQRMQPGHEINKLLNNRYHRLKAEKKFKKVGDLVISDVTEIVNTFKGEIMNKNIKLF